MNSYPPYKIFLIFALVFICAALFYLGTDRSNENKWLLPESRRPPEISGIKAHPSDVQVAGFDSSSLYRNNDFPPFISPVGIEYPNGDTSILLPFCESVGDIKNGGQSRIFYYGDSQLEGDRISIFFREQLQRKYGGFGPGMIPLVEPLYGSIGVAFKQTGKWYKFDNLVNRKPAPGAGLGTMLSYTQYEGERASIMISFRELSDMNEFYFDSFRLIISPGDSDGQVDFSIPGQDHGRWQITSSDKLVELGHNYSAFQKDITLDFENLSSARIMGLSLESTTGMQVDNIAHRGSAGLEFSVDKSGSFGEMAEFLGPDLLILQFGLNVVPAKSDDFNYYREYLKKEIHYLKHEVPGVPVLLVGVSDMGHMVNGIPAGYSSVEKVNLIQRKVAEETGCAFFDLLAFMGGPGSFRIWMDSDPVLMRSDFAHFSQSGGAMVANGLASALISEVDKTLNQN